MPNTLEGRRVHHDVAPAEQLLHTLGVPHIPELASELWEARAPPLVEVPGLHLVARHPHDPRGVPAPLELQEQRGPQAPGHPGDRDPHEAPARMDHGVKTRRHLCADFETHWSHFRHCWTPRSRRNSSTDRVRDAPEASVTVTVAGARLGSATFITCPSAWTS